MDLDKKLSVALSEAPIDLVRPHLDPEIFNEDEEIKPEIIEFLKKIVDDIDENIVPVVGKSLIKGSILSYQWLPATDVDLLIEIDEKINDHQWDVIREQINDRYEDVVIPGTKHPLEIFPQRGDYNVNNADGIYDLYKGWIKGPYSHEADLSQYMDKFEKTVQSLDIDTGELRRDLIDYSILKSLPEDEIKGLKAMLRSKLDEIDSGVEELLHSRQKVKDARMNAFKRDMTPQEIAEYGSKNLLPANIIQKLLERYHYMNMLSEIKDLYEEGEEISDDDIDELNNIFSIGEL